MRPSLRNSSSCSSSSSSSCLFTLPRCGEEFVRLLVVLYTATSQIITTTTTTTTNTASAHTTVVRVHCTCTRVARPTCFRKICPLDLEQGSVDKLYLRNFSPFDALSFTFYVGQSKSVVCRLWSLRLLHQILFSDRFITEFTRLLILTSSLSSLLSHTHNTLRNQSQSFVYTQLRKTRFLCLLSSNLFMLIRYLSCHSHTPYKYSFAHNLFCLCFQTWWWTLIRQTWITALASVLLPSTTIWAILPI